MAEKERCPICGKVCYHTWAHAANDAKRMNRKKKDTGHQQPYRGECGRLHVGQATSNKRRLARQPPDWSDPS